VEPSKLYERRGDDLVVDVPVTFSEAALGATIEVPTPDGAVSLKVKPGTQDGKLLRVQGKGASRLKGSGRGDVLARLRVAVPTRLKKRERELLEELQKVSGEDPRGRLFS
jgi:molecular chaperone DnaJ